MKKSFWILCLFVGVSFAQSQAHAWGKWGHATVGQTAALLLDRDPTIEAKMLGSHSWGMGYYNNVPDIVWKSLPGKYPIERAEHFHDTEIFLREKTTDKLANSRKEFEEKNKKVPLLAGRALWRISELNEKLTQLTSKLKENKAGKNLKKYQKTQGQWLSLAGVMGHYVADLSQPLHCSENYDGQLTGQKGLHAFFEEVLVDQLEPAVAGEVFVEAQKRWPKFKEENKALSVFELSQKLCSESVGHLPEVLKVDKEVGRADIAKAASAHKKLIVDRLALGSLYLAEIWRRQLGWTYRGKKFYFFDHKPAYIRPGRR
ncbi:MAG: hypothetical protein H6626_10365 [Pseudobdellovibrionaceae bacterium]|nr:MAG: hypothetical protein H6626_10365 [Pseudobdellovibrionaceae bacterium]